MFDGGKRTFSNKKMSLTILGVDPGSRVTGYGVVRVENGRLIHVAHGVILPEPGDGGDMSLVHRLAEMGRGLREVLARHVPDHVAVEKIFLGKNADSAFKLGHARGVLLYEASLAGSEVMEYATRSVKKGVTGNGGASKEDVQHVLLSLLKLSRIQRIDASDALALAVHHASQLQRLSLMSRAKEI